MAGRRVEGYNANFIRSDAINGEDGPLGIINRHTNGVSHLGDKGEAKAGFVAPDGVVSVEEAR